MESKPEAELTSHNIVMLSICAKHDCICPGPPRGGAGGKMPRGPATFRGPAGPTVNIVNMRYERALYKRALYERARDRSAQGPGFSLGGPVYVYCSRNLDTNSIFWKTLYINDLHFRRVPMTSLLRNTIQTVVCADYQVILKRHKSSQDVSSFQIICINLH